MTCHDPSSWRLSGANCREIDASERDPIGALGRPSSMHRSIVVLCVLAIAACRVPTQRDIVIGFAATQAVAGASIATYAIVSDDEGNANVQLWGGVGLLGTAALSIALAYLLPPPQPPENPLRPRRRE